MSINICIERYVSMCIPSAPCLLHLPAAHGQSSRRAMPRARPAATCVCARPTAGPAPSSRAYRWPGLAPSATRAGSSTTTLATPRATACRAPLSLLTAAPAWRPGPAPPLPTRVDLPWVACVPAGPPPTAQVTWCSCARPLPPPIGCASTLHCAVATKLVNGRTGHSLCLILPAPELTERESSSPLDELLLHTIC